MMLKYTSEKTQTGKYGGIFETEFHDITLSAYKHGKMYAFFNDKNGVLKTEARNEFGTKAVRAESLIKKVEKELGKGPWYGVSVQNGIVFSGDARINKKSLLLLKTGLLKLIYPLFASGKTRKSEHLNTKCLRIKL